MGRMIKSQPDSSPLGSSETQFDFIRAGGKGNKFYRSSFPISERLTELGVCIYSVWAPFYLCSLFCGVINKTWPWSYSLRKRERNEGCIYAWGEWREVSRGELKGLSFTMFSITQSREGYQILLITI